MKILKKNQKCSLFKDTAEIYFQIHKSKEKWRKSEKIKSIKKTKWKKSIEKTPNIIKLTKNIYERGCYQKTKDIKILNFLNKVYHINIELTSILRKNLKRVTIKSETVGENATYRDASKRKKYKSNYGKNSY